MDDLFRPVQTSRCSFITSEMHALVASL